jgi:hypothetical protein
VSGSLPKGFGRRFPSWRPKTLMFSNYSGGCYDETFEFRSIPKARQTPICTTGDLLGLPCSSRGTISAGPR